jgi:hypothetical protein
MQFTNKPCFADYVPPVQAQVAVKKFMNDHPDGGVGGAVEDTRPVSAEMTKERATSAGASSV